jgi:hypothetical protein
VTVHHLNPPQPPDAVQVDPWHPSGAARGFTGTVRAVQRADFDAPSQPGEPIEVGVSGGPRATNGVHALAGVRRSGAGSWILTDHVNRHHSAHRRADPRWLLGESYWTTADDHGDSERTDRRWIRQIRGDC